MRWVVLLFLLLCGVVVGDVIHLADGRRIEGRVVKETEDAVWVEKPGGVRFKISREDIVEIERRKTAWEEAEEEFKRRYEEVKGDADGLYLLAEWAKKHGLARKVKELLKRVLELEPDHEGARAALGYVRRDGKWVKAGASRGVAGLKVLTAARRKELERLVERFFAEPGKRPQILERLKRTDGIPVSAAAHFAKLAFKYARKYGLKVTEGESRFGHPEYPGLIFVKVVRQQGHKGRLPLFVALHGGGRGAGHYLSAVRAWFRRVRARLKNFIFFAPTVLRKEYAEWGGNPKEEAYVKEVIKAIKRTFDVDTDRVYLAGYSMGAYGTWHIGGHEADVFAGLVSGAGGMLILRHLKEPWGKGIIANLMHTPIAFAHGSSDRPAPVWSDREANRILNQLQKKYPGCYKHIYFEVPGGHQAAASKLNQMLDWIFKFKRSPYPKQVIWEPKRKFNHYFFWLKVKEPKMGQRIEAKIKGNTITIKTENIKSGLSVLLNEKLIDPKKKVRIVLNGKEVFNDYVRARVGVILESVDEKIDERMWFWGRVDL